MDLPDPTFPPLFTGHAVRAPLLPFEEAARGAAESDYGAGDIVWARSLDRMSVALVLEPEVSLATACQMGPLAHVAVAETLGHLCPPQMPVLTRWPDVVLVNGAVCGHVRLAAPHLDPAAVPAWLVIGIDLTINDRQRSEPGERPQDTSLMQEGATVTRTDLIEALATRLLAWLHTWQEDGFRPIHDAWLFRAEGHDSDVTIDGIAGRVMGLDEHAGLLLKPSAGGPVRVLAALPHVEASP